MATTDYDFNLTRNEIIERAYRIIGVITTGETMTAEQVDQGVKALNSLVKQWQTKHLFLWTVQKKSQTLSASTSSYTQSNDLINIDMAWYTQSNQQVPVEVITYREYESITNKTSTGQPVVVCLDYQTSSPTMYVWPTPSSTLTLDFLGIIRLKDMDTASGNPDIPQRFLNALVYGLAYDLSDEFGLPISERNYLQRKALAAFGDAKASDREVDDYEFVVGAFESHRKY